MSLPNYQSTLGSYDLNSLNFAMGMCGFTCTVLWYTAITCSIDPKRRFAEDAKSVALLENQGMIDSPTLPETDANKNEGTRGQRWSNIKDNQMENIPMALVLFMMAYYFAIDAEALISQEADNYYAVKALTVFVWTFTVARFFYVICYLYALQPFRSIVWFLATFSVIGTACLLPYLTTAFYVADKDRLIGN